MEPGQIGRMNVEATLILRLEGELDLALLAHENKSTRDSVTQSVLCLDIEPGSEPDAR